LDQKSNSSLPPSLDDEQVSKFLKMSLSEGGGGKPRQIDELLDRLQLEDGMRWLREGALKVFGLTPTPEAVLIEGKPCVAEIEELKRRGKALGVGEGDRRLLGLAVYYMAVAAGLRTHGALHSRVERTSWAEILLDLEGGCPEPWKSFFGDARKVLENLGER
jgi:hypothetical protein